jgi:hypothetical protein
VNELTFVQSERSFQVREEVSFLGSNGKDFLVKGLLISSLGFRESSLLLFKNYIYVTILSLSYSIPDVHYLLVHLRGKPYQP